MIRSIQLQGFRRFSRFELSSLSRVNLLVGKNNSGKTSVLDALNLLATGGDPASFWRIASRQSERLAIAPCMGGSRYSEADISRLFSMPDLKPDLPFSISAMSGTLSRSIECSMREATPEDTAVRFAPDSNRPPESRFVLDVMGSPRHATAKFLLSRNGKLIPELLQHPETHSPADASVIPVQYICTEPVSESDLAAAWNKIALRKGEKPILDALRLLEPKIENIAVAVLSEFHLVKTSVSGIFIKLTDKECPVPIRSFGHGVWRVLTLAIALVQAERGLLLIDEIDAGLHYSVMEDVWKLIYATAKELNVQVFATTHSYDCIRSLASICNLHVTENSDVTLHRIEAGRDKAIFYTESEIRIATAKDMEMR